MMKALLILNFIIPFVMILVAFLLKKRRFPYPGPFGSPKWKVDGSGYNTPRSRKSQAHWDFAQAAAPDIFLKYGTYTLIPSTLATAAGLLLPWQPTLAAGLGIGFIMLYCAFFKTEKAIKENFND